MPSIWNVRQIFSLSSLIHLAISYAKIIFTLKGIHTINKGRILQKWAPKLGSLLGPQATLSNTSCINWKQLNSAFKWHLPNVSMIRSLEQHKLWPPEWEIIRWIPLCRISKMSKMPFLTSKGPNIEMRCRNGVYRTSKYATSKSNVECPFFGNYYDF